MTPKPTLELAEEILKLEGHALWTNSAKELAHALIESDKEKQATRRAAQGTIRAMGAALDRAREEKQALREALRQCKLVAEASTVDEPVGLLPNKIAALVGRALPPEEPPASSHDQKEER